MICKQSYCVENKIEVEALFIVEKELALFISDYIYKATVISSAGRELRGLSRLRDHTTNAFQDPT